MTGLTLLLTSPSPTPGVAESGSPLGALIGIAVAVLLVALLCAGRDLGRKR